MKTRIRIATEPSLIRAIRYEMDLCIMCNKPTNLQQIQDITLVVAKTFVKKKKKERMESNMLALCQTLMYEEKLLPNTPEPRGKPMQINCFVDSDHASNLVTQCSHTGILTFLNKAPVY